MRAPYFHADSKSPEIVRLWRSGVKSRTEIARRVGCSMSNVRKVIMRHVPEYTTPIMVSGLTVDQVKWLEAEASKSGVTPDVMARALLIDAIEEARQGR